MGRGHVGKKGQRPLYGASAHGPMAAARARRSDRRRAEDERRERLADDLSWQWDHSKSGQVRSLVLSFYPPKVGIAHPRARLLAQTQTQPMSEPESNRRLRWELYLVHDGQTPRLALVECLAFLGAGGIVVERHHDLIDLYDDPRPAALRAQELARNATARGWQTPDANDLIRSEDVERELACRDL